ncbi:Long-chain-fatty-acid--CoA ligase [Mycobacterium marinum str. Europe]|nr:Long-chain-fatty-acid--CoA ligase [Mycobacterium marinum str. Europe]
MVIDQASRLRYRELDSSTSDLAAAFIQAGVGKGTRVGLIMPNGVRWVQIAIALTRIGAVLVPLSTLLRPRELASQLRSAAVQFLISVPEFRGHRYFDAVESVPKTELPALQRVWADDQVSSSNAGARALRMVEPIAKTVTAADTLVIMFTSGSTGAPKGVLHSHGSALGAVRSGPDRAPHHLGHPAVSADAVLLGGRVWWRNPLGAARGSHPGDRGAAVPREHLAPAGGRARHDVSWVA